MRRPLEAEHPVYYKHYIDLVKSDDIIKELSAQVIDFQELISEISVTNENESYAPGKWTAKEVIGHITDTERIFACRALSFARKDKTALPGFNENDYVYYANFKNRTIYDLAHEFAVLRESNITLFRSFDTEALDQIGNANGRDVSVRAILFMLAGHAAHHMNVVKTKYLENPSV